MAIDKNEIFRNVFAGNQVPEVSDSYFVDFNNAVAQEIVRNRGKSPGSVAPISDETSKGSEAQNLEPKQPDHGLGTSNLVLARRGPTDSGQPHEVQSDQRDASAGAEQPLALTEEPVVASTAPKVEPEISDVTVEDATRGVGHVKPGISQDSEVSTGTEDQQPRTLVDFEEIGPEGERLVEQPADGGIKIFDAPVRPDALLAAPPVISDNASRAQDAVSGATIADQVRVNTDTAPELLTQAEDGTSTAETIDTKATAATASNTTGAPEEAPVVTMDRTSNPTILAQPGEAPAEPSAPNAEETDTAAATLPPEADPYTVKIRRPVVPEGKDQVKTQDPTVYPAKQQFVAEDPVGNGGGERIAKIKAGINENQFGQEIASQRPTDAQSALASAPESPEMQTQVETKPEVHVDGRPGVLAEIRPASISGVQPDASVENTQTGNTRATGETALINDTPKLEFLADEDNTNHQEVARILSSRPKVTAQDLHGLSVKLTKNHKQLKDAA